jgi:hypothetical protein
METFEKVCITFACTGFFVLIGATLMLFVIA